MSPTLLDTVLAGFNVDRDIREAITGDLFEEHAALAAVHGESSADRWLRRQVIRAVVELVRASVCEGGFRQLLPMVGAAFAALIAVSLSTEAFASIGLTLASRDAFMESRTVAPIIDLICGGAGGYLAARLSGRAPLGASFLFGIVGASLTLFFGDTGHGWERLVLPFLLLPTTILAGWSRSRRLARRAGIP